jgi:hypothetical protein
MIVFVAKRGKHKSFFSPLRATGLALGRSRADARHFVSPLSQVLPPGSPRTVTAQRGTAGGAARAPARRGLDWEQQGTSGNSGNVSGMSSLRGSFEVVGDSPFSGQPPPVDSPVVSAQDTSTLPFSVGCSK